jgi:hypothetical protein
LADKENSAGVKKKAIMYAKSDFRKELVAFMGYRFCRTSAGSMLRSEDCQQKKEEKPNVFPPQHIISVVFTPLSC